MENLKQKPQFMMVYRCSSCDMESGMSELELPSCRYCDATTGLTLISKEPITPETLSARMKATTDNMMKALREAYREMPKEKAATENEEDPEKQFLELMARAQALRDHIHKLELKEPEEGS